MKRNLLLGVSLTLLLGVSGATICNKLFNSRKEKTASYVSLSEPRRVAGHLEYTFYKDGSQEMKIYARTFGDTVHYFDFDGDNAVDRIRVDGSALKMDSLREILIRENDYLGHKGEFDAADKILKEMSEKHRKAF